MCELLLAQKGVDVNAMAASGGTALMFAAAGGFKDVSILLLLLFLLFIVLYCVWRGGVNAPVL